MRRLLSRIGVRLLLFNVLVVFLPVGGLLSLHTLEVHLLDVQERSMVQQGRVVAAALGSESPMTIDPARNLVERLRGRSEARIRIVDAKGDLLADSARVPVRRSTGRSGMDAVERASRSSILYRIGAALWRPLKPLADRWRRPERSGVAVAEETTPRTVVQKALAGKYGAALQPSAGQRSLTLYSALPITGSDGSVIGAVVVSQSTARTLRALWGVRLDVFRVFVVSLAMAMILTLVFATTIARPLVRLRDEAGELLDTRGRLKKTFRGSKRRDEIGDLARTLAELTSRLERHLSFVEGFSADVTHEFKNPLATIRSAAELLASTDDASQKEQLAAMIESEVGRLNRLLNGVREISRIDASIETESVERIDLRGVLNELADRGTAIGSAVAIEVAAPRNVVVRAAPDRLRQALANIVDNAVSFSPRGSRIVVSLSSAAGRATVTIDDDGPGIPAENLDRIFDRFFSYRSSCDQANHDGLGLAIARAVIEGSGGTIRASNRSSGGARFEIALPLAD